MTSPIDFEKLSFDDASKALETKIRDDQAKGWRGERAPEVARAADGIHHPLDPESPRRRCARSRCPAIFRGSPTRSP